MLKRMVHVPFPVAAVLTVVILVAVPASVVFLVTTSNAEDSIDEVSRRLAMATMEAVEHRIYDTAINEPEAELRAAKADIEMNVAGLKFPENELFWGKRMMHWLELSDLYTLYIAVGVSKEVGDIYGHGAVVDYGDVPMLYVSRPPHAGIWRLDKVNITWTETAFSYDRNFTLDFPTRPYALAYTQGAQGEANCRANIPFWTELEISIKTSNRGGGLFTTITLPVFQTQDPNPNELIGVVAMGIYLAEIDLVPFLLSNTSSLLIMDSDTSIISSTDLPQNYYELNSSGVVSLEQFTLESTGLPLFQDLLDSGKLPSDLATRGDDTFFETMNGPDGEYWITIRTITHYNLRWHVVMLTPEKIFFEKIYDSNRSTLITVIVMILASCLISIGLTLLATDDLKRLARAFDKIALIQLDHPSVQHVRTRHIISEYDSLCKGFWHAVEMVTHVQAFLPKVDLHDDIVSNESTSLVSHSHVEGGRSHKAESRSQGASVTGSMTDKPSIAAVSGGKVGRSAVADSFSVGLRMVSGVTGLIVSLDNFSHFCHSSADRASAAHGELFTLIHDTAKRFHGVIASLEGARVTVAWNTAKPCQPVTSTQHALSVAFELSRSKSALSFSSGVHHARTYHGILGSKSQRFNTIGSNLTDVACHLAHYASGLKVLPAILVSGAVVEYVKGFCCYKIDEVKLLTGETIPVFWAEKQTAVDNAEWMYQLREEEEARKTFLDNYFTAITNCDASGARVALKVFSDQHPKFSVLVHRLRTALDGRFYDVDA
ncbi:hypothetical protein DIPPA_16144 [Diplonema papillatum]|nr:hypothetical protein DIPPA_16144 [Diplonema papillatum]